MPSAWEETKGSKDVKVAVIDSGIDYQHEDLSGNVDESLGYDFFYFFKKIIIQNILTIFMQH